MATELANSPVVKIRKYLTDPGVQKRLEEMLGKNAGAFTNSLINVVRGSESLQGCDPDSIMAAAMRAASVKLAIDPSLGQAAIVPYSGQATFQLMYKGVTQLCIRSGQYKTMNVTEVYADELKSYDPITGKAEFNDPATYKMRYADPPSAKNIVGYYAYFELLAGFEKPCYMSHAEVLAHAKKYSKAYQYDLQKNKKGSKWSTDFVPMACKTVLLRLLTKYGIMSIEMQEAFGADRESYEAAEIEAGKRIAADAGSQPIDTNFETPQPAESETPDNDPMAD